ncbi:MAG TPA: choice-of-anchor Q domain-containing protein [Solirubrobacterales bacterium]|nr:choice-of-anchor Q domain-containing protein [Solirubrobacterales bacterium]
MRNGIRTLGIALGAVALLFCLAGSAAAQTYTVTRTDDPTPAPCEPTDCSLRNALMAANATTTVDDVVVLPASSTPYVLQYEELALPIADEVEVRGAGADKTVIKGDGKESIFFVGPFKATLTGLTITGGNSAIQSNGQLLVRAVAIEGNKWNGGTAGIITNGPLTVEASFLGFNHTESSSGGVIHANAAVAIVNSTIAHNTSKEGAGAISGNAAVTLVNTAVVSNRSETAPAAAVGGAPLTVRNSLFADNRDTAGVLSCFSFMPISSLGGNVSDDASCGSAASDKPNVNLGLGPLELHGGTTPVYSLLAGSPAIDATSDCPPVDQRGLARPQGAACDSGPYEVEQSPSVPAPDRELTMRIGKGKLRMDDKGRIRVRLSCPATEVSSPCRGRVVVSPKKPYWPLEPCGCVEALKAVSARARFSIPAGNTKALFVKLPRRLAKRIPDHWKPRKVLLRVSAADGAGNRQGIAQRRKLVPAKRG